MPFLRSTFAFLLLTSVSFAQTELRTLDGKSLRGKITEFSPTEATIITDTETAKVPLSKVLAVNFAASRNPLGKYAEVRLADDTNLLCTKVIFKEKTVSLTLTSGAVVELPHDYVLHIVQEAQDAALRKKFVDVARNKIKKDRIVVLAGGELNALEGSLGKIDAAAQTIEFGPEGLPARAIAFSRLHGLLFYRREAILETPVCVIYDSQGNSLAATSIALKNGKYEFTTTFGSRLAFEPEILSKLDFNMGKLTYLSDLEPTRVIEKSAAGLIVRYRKDVNLDGDPILLDKEYPRGLSLHAHTELDFNLAGKYKLFKAVLGIDPRIESGSQPIVTILCDGEKRYSGTVAANVYAPLNIDVRDVATLRIMVSSSNLLDLHDHVTLAEARVSQ